jgi:hypothetical protein
VNGDRIYASYSDGYDLENSVEKLLNASGVDLHNGGDFKELRQFQEYFFFFFIIVCDGLYPDRVTFRGNSLSAT